MNVSSLGSSPVQSTQRPTQLQKTEESSEQQQQQKSEVQQTQATPPKPVINTQGQTTGRLLNVTA